MHVFGITGSLSGSWIARVCYCSLTDPYGSLQQIVMKNIQFGIQYYFKDILFSVIKSLIVSYQSSVVTTEVRF